MTANRTKRFALACACVLMSAGCVQQQRTDGLAPITFGAQAMAPSAAGAVTVAAGDTLYEISRRYNVPVRELIELNRLEAPYLLRVGQRLVLPTARFHAVQPGDTLYAVSRMYQADMAELARVNGLTDPYHIRVGQSLRLPGASSADARIATAPEPARKPGAGVAVAAAPADASPMVSAPADTSPMVSAQADTSPVLSAPASAGTMVLPPSKPVSARNVPVPAPEVVAASPPPAAPPPPSVPAARPPAAPRAAPPAVEPPPRAAARFAWPVRGEILSEFGSKADGLHNDGINIAAPQGTQVFAAENGVVAYAGNELRGFGNLLLIRHADGWMTAYAHLDRMTVQRGDRVGRRQSIGTVGSTGSVRVPQLHFEVRKGSRAVDPKDLLDSEQVSRGVSPDVRPGPG